jgi:hypothetical protein
MAGIRARGLNNGRIAMSARFLGDRLGLSHDSAAKAIRELVTFGFLARGWVWQIPAA